MDGRRPDTRRKSPTITTPDDAELFYKDGGSGPLVVLSHGWPLNSDSWEAQQVDVPMLVIHGDDDQIVPFDVGGKASAALVEHAELKVYPGGPHGITDTHKEQLSDDLLAYVRERRSSAAGAAGLSA
jgi:pimeloyl-ACP methyl ester carboxylesterase